MTDDQMICSSCKKPKHDLKRRVSKLIPGAPLFLCHDCLMAKREPRGFVVMAGREHGVESIKFWIKPQRYVGDPITLRELHTD